MRKNILYKFWEYILNAFKPYEEHEIDMPTLELKYFDLKGIAECIRLVFKYGDISFKDIRIDKAAFEDTKATLPFKQLPELVINDERIVQSKAILRYAGRMTHTYPNKTSLHAAIVDQWVELHSEFMFPLFMNMYPEKFGLSLTSEDKQSHRDWCVNVHIPKYFAYIEKECTDNTLLGGMDSLSIADFCWLPTLQWLKSGMFEGCDAEQFEAFDGILQYMTCLENALSENVEDTFSRSNANTSNHDDEKKIL